jgi:hypothetical protein
MISMTTYGILAGGTPDYFRLNVIVKTKAGYVVMSESKGVDGKRKRLSKPYKSRGEAVRRLAIIDYLKAHKS